METKHPLHTYFSAIGRAGATKRWANTSPENKAKHLAKMAKARADKAPVDKPILDS